MILEIDDQGAVNLANSWSACERTHNVDTCHNFLHKPREDGILPVKCIPGPSTDVDLYMNTLAGPKFEKRLETYDGKDKYSSMS